MNPIHSWTLVEMLSALWKHVGRRRRIQLIAIGALMLLSIIAELASIGAILPFLGALSAPENLFSNAWAGPLVHGLGP